MTALLCCGSYVAVMLYNKNAQSDLRTSGRIFHEGKSNVTADYVSSR